jgi:hypothetical protein
MLYEKPSWVPEGCPIVNDWSYREYEHMQDLAMRYMIA